MLEQPNIPHIKTTPRHELRIFWEGLVSEFEHSGETIKNFSRIRQIPECRLIYWKNYFKKKASSKSSGAESKASTFMPVRLAETRMNPSAIVIYIGSCSRIELPTPPDEKALRTILTLMAGY